MQSIRVDRACQGEPPALCPDKVPSNIYTLTRGRSIPGYRFSLWSQVNGTKSEVTLIFLILAQCYAKSRLAPPQAALRNKWPLDGCRPCSSQSLFLAGAALKGICFQPGVAKAAISFQCWLQVCLMFTAV